MLICRSNDDKNVISWHKAEYKSFHFLNALIIVVTSYWHTLRGSVPFCPWSVSGMCISCISCLFWYWNTLWPLQSILFTRKSGKILCVSRCSSRLSHLPTSSRFMLFFLMFSLSADCLKDPFAFNFITDFSLFYYKRLRQIYLLTCQKLIQSNHKQKIKVIYLIYATFTSFTFSRSITFAPLTLPLAVTWQSPDKFCGIQQSKRSHFHVFKCTWDKSCMICWSFRSHPSLQ